MAWPTSLVTNEVRNAAGTEVEFLRRDSDGPSLEFLASGEAPNLPHRLVISHQDVGSGITKRRRSAIILDLYEIGADGVTPVRNRAQTLVDIPVGNISNYTGIKNALAELGSFVHTLGTSTHLYDGTGTGAAAIINGTL